MDYTLLDGRYPVMLTPTLLEHLSEQEIAVQDRVAVEYEEKRYRHAWSRRYHDWWVSLMTDGIDTSGRILDNGCGTGMLFEALPGANIVGIDLSRQMIRLAGQKNTRVLVGDSLHLPFENGGFDLVLSRSLLHHLPNVEGGIAEIHRVLRRGGEMVAVDTNATLLSELPRRIANRGAHFSEQHKNLHRRELLPLVRRYFRLDRVTFFGYLAYPLLGFPDLVDVYRFVPGKRIFTPLLMGLDRLISHIPLLRTQSWGILLKGVKEA